MKGFVGSIEQETLENEAFRRVLYTARNCQLVVMSILPGEDIGEEVHSGDQFIRVEEGTGNSILDGIEHAISDGTALVIPAGTRHNIINTSTSDALKLYTLYAPPHHKDGITQETKKEALQNSEHFDGGITEKNTV